MSPKFLDVLTTFSPLLIMWGTVLLNIVIPLNYSAHPARLWNRFALILAQKVNTHRSHSQDQISGTLACGLMLLPALAILIAFQTLTWQDAYYQFALLFLALDWRNQLQLANKMCQWMSKEDKASARAELAPVLNREVGTLSILGLGKATVETVIAGQSRQVIGVLFWFALTGGTGAFFYRLICELHRAWSPSKPGFRPFGSACANLMLLLEWIPVRLFLLLLIAGREMSVLYFQAKQQYSSWISPSQGYLLAAIGHKFQLSLGGPAIYKNKGQDSKSVRTKLGGRIAPAPLHISQVMRLLNQRTLWWLAIQSILMISGVMITNV